ncbi:hypothetical protein Tco_1387379 [Tanacetum coccineum]
MCMLTAITIKGIGWPKAVNTARPNSVVVNTVRANQVNAIKDQHVGFGDLPNLIGHLQKEDQGYVDSGCSRHMIGNMSNLSDFKEFDRGYVTFRGKAQKMNQMCTYLKNMANYKHSQSKNKSFKEIQMLFDNTMKWVDLFVPMDTELVEGNENVEAEVDDEAEMKKHMEIVPDEGG